MVRVKISNCISRLFWFGTDVVGIQKMRSLFFEEAKAAALQLHSPPAGEANATNLKEKTNIAGHLRIKHLILFLYYKIICKIHMG